MSSIALPGSWMEMQCFPYRRPTRKVTSVAAMAIRDKVQETIARARELGHETERVLSISFHTELRAVQTMCILARQESGQDRAHHLREAEKRFQAALQVAKRLKLSQQDRDDIEQARQNISLIAGKDFSPNR